MNLETVAEGVEQAEEMLMLIQQGCTTGQGFHFSPAIPADDLMTLLHDQSQPFEAQGNHPIIRLSIIAAPGVPEGHYQGNEEVSVQFVAQMTVSGQSATSGGAQRSCLEDSWQGSHMSMCTPEGLTNSGSNLGAARHAKARAPQDARQNCQESHECPGDAGPSR